jgi:hypothetical protein
MTTVEEGLQSQLRNIETTYGRPIDEWVEEIGRSGLTRHPDVVAMLKTKFGMTHGAAHRVSLVARDRFGAAGAGLAKAPAAEVQGVYDRLLGTVRSFGEDVEEAPKKGYVSLRRRKQFAMLQPASRSVNVGLILPGVEPAGRLEAAGSWNALFTHRVRVSAEAEVDAELTGLLREAYSRSG